MIVRGCLLLALLGAASVCAADYDILIRNGRVIDGAGNPWFRADVGIKNGRIAALGSIPANATADRTIDAQGRVVTPGFIDVHTHVESGIEKIPRADNFLLDGVTTIVTGNCGSSEADLAKWFAQLDQLGLGLNLASLYGHNTVRSEVMGRANRSATAEEIARMQALVDKAMQDGAVGFSTGLEYVPGTYSSSDEVIALAKSAARHGGVYASHMRDEGPVILDAIHEACRIGEVNRMPVQISHFKIDTKRIWGASDKSLALVEEYRRKGVDVVVDQYPYDRYSTGLSIQLPTWALADGQAAVKERLTNPGTRKRIAAEMEKKLREDGYDDYSFIMIASFRPNPAYEGKTISEINTLRGRSRSVANEIETIFEIVLQGGASGVFHGMGEVDVDRIMRYPNTAIASDGGVREFGVGMPHPRSYGTNARVLAEYVRRRNVLTLEDAVRRMTSLPARTFRFKDRGLLREGAVADVLVFDPAKVTDKSSFTNPHQYSEGFDFVLVNGKLAVDEGKLTTARAGQVIRRGK